MSVPLAAIEDIIDTSGTGQAIEDLLPHGVRGRQLTTRTLLTGMMLTLADGRPAHLTFNTLAANAGLPPVRLHDLRHGAATLMLLAEVDLRVVQEMLGHSSIVLTADTYTSVLPAVAHSAAEKVAMLIIRAGCLVPGTRRRRRRKQGTRVRRRGPGRGQGRVRSYRRSRAHPARQIGHPRSRHCKRVR